MSVHPIVHVLKSQPRTRMPPANSCGRVRLEDRSRSTMDYVANPGPQPAAASQD
jgi:hypothetical protein